MPNLQAMRKEDLSAFALGQFNQQLDPALKKDEMIQQIVSLANSRAAGADVMAALADFERFVVPFVEGASAG